MIPIRSWFLFLSVLFAQSLSAGEASVTFVFLNSATGTSLPSYELRLQSPNDQRHIGGDNSLSQSMILREGNWQATIQAPGFRSMTTAMTTVANTSPRIEFNLDPIVLPAELQSNNIISLHKTDATLVVGFVVDERTHEPLPDVTVRSNSSSAKTDARGFYRIYLPLASNTIVPTLEFHRAGYQTEVRENMETWSNGDWISNIAMKEGSGVNRIDVSKTAQQKNDSGSCDNCDANNPAGNDALASSVVIPSSIRVGRGCTGTSCASVQVYSIQTYAKYVLAAEWYSCWGSLSNGMNSLLAGAVSIRSYGLWYVYHPLTSTYDICDNTFCQVFGSAQSTNANNAVDATDRYIMTDFGLTSVMRAEYAAENNNKGCGDGFTGTGTSWPCISDLVCQGQTSNGHGRGVCQWGTIRWANGTRVLTTSPCAQGASHGLGTKTWQEILSHYYPSYSLIQGSTATLLSAAANPATVVPGSTFEIQCTLNTTDDMVLMVGAAVAPSGTSTYTYDVPHDVKLSFFAGEFPASRQFTAPQAPEGSYDMVVSLWFDKNNNNIIDEGDFLLNSQLYPNAFTIASPNGVDEQLPAAFRLYQNYPNPFNPETEIQFSVETYGFTTLRVFDLLGREVATLFNAAAEPGRIYRIKLHGGSLPAGRHGLASGVYMYRLTSGTMSDMKRLMLLR